MDFSPPVIPAQALGYSVPGPRPPGAWRPALPHDLHNPRAGRGWLTCGGLRRDTDHDRQPEQVATWSRFS